MKYARIDECEICNGIGVGVSLYTQGCIFHCKGCFNQELWDLDGGNLWTSHTEDQLIMSLNRDYIKRLTVLGGEPLLDRNIDDLSHLFSRVKDLYPDLTIWLYSGYTYEVILEKFPSILDNVDYLVDGPYIEEMRDLTLPFRGSKNQRIINVKTREVL